MPEFVVFDGERSDKANILAPLFRSPIVDRGADAIVAAAAAVGDFFDPRHRTLDVRNNPAPMIVWGPDIQPAPDVLPMWNADP